MRTQVGIVGAGPAGLLLAHLLHLRGVDSVVLEARSQKYVEARVRAGVLEYQTAELFKEAGVGHRMEREGLVHKGINLRFQERTHRIDLQELSGGRTVTVYGQHEVVKDLIAARQALGSPLVFDVEDVELRNLDGEQPSIVYRKDGEVHELRCDFVAGCDGFHGVCRPCIPDGILTRYESSFPFAWLGILARARPSSEELIYANHERGFALLSMRSTEISRLYIQCDPTEDLALWPDDRLWAELRARLACESPDWALTEGPILQKSIAPMRSFVVEPMQYGRLFLAGDSAHIVPPAGAKGMNLAVADVRMLALALSEFYSDGRRQRLVDYSAACLRRVWNVQRFSWWMTNLLHRFPGASPFDGRRQIAELDYVTRSRAASQTLAENYVGLPFDVTAD
jgi:p-hydroxybenzoate 3-monooxygenase